MADRSFLSPIIGMWGPNIIIFFIAIYLLINTIREKAPIGIKFFNLFKRKKVKTNDSF